MAEELSPHLKWDQSLAVTQETLYMTALSRAAILTLGTTPGLVLFLAVRDGLLPNRAAYGVISLVVNTFRSVPFIISVVLFIPLIRATVDTTPGTNAALPALIVGAASFYARPAETALHEMNKGVTEATRSTGARLSMFTSRILLPEPSPTLVPGITVMLIVPVSYSSMARVTGAGGLGNLAHLGGLQRNHSDVMLVATVTILLIAFIIQLCGDVIAFLLNKR